MTSAGTTVGRIDGGDFSANVVVPADSLCGDFMKGSSGMRSGSSASFLAFARRQQRFALTAPRRSSCACSWLFPWMRIVLACCFALSICGCAIDEDLDREPVAAHRELLVKTVAEIMEPDDRVRLATNLPPGVQILNIPDEFYKTKIPLFILFSETRYEILEGTKLLNLNPLGKPMASLNAPVTPEALKLMGFVRVFDIIEVPKVTAILRSIEHANHTKLILRDVTLSAEDVEIIKRMPALKGLCCYGVRFAEPKAAVFPLLIDMDFRAVEPPGVETVVLNSAPEIETLTIKEKQLTDKDITAISKLRHLGWLSLMNCNLSNEWLQRILAARQPLYSLGVHNTNVTDAGMVGVEKFRGLKYLNLSRCDIGDATMKRVATLPLLSLIDACYTNVSDIGVQYLAGLPSLETLSLMNTKITEKCLPGLALMKKLAKLRLTGLTSSRETLQKLKDALPNCKIN